MKPVVSGKGSVGKTSVAAAPVKLISRENRCVFAIDADPGEGELPDRLCR
ncbi:MAG: hypothetical protein BWY80_01247 [Firmicutes bacterium ADurb.Bin456]|nr:MAG: hypothetical protein BWY80_01247 [Firmicutes bacterium ADurb.Bin456]